MFCSNLYRIVWHVATDYSWLEKKKHCNIKFVVAKFTSIEHLNERKSRLVNYKIYSLVVDCKLHHKIYALKAWNHWISNKKRKKRRKPLNLNVILTRLHWILLPERVQPLIYLHRFSCCCCLFFGHDIMVAGRWKQFIGNCYS